MIYQGHIVDVPIAGLMAPLSGHEDTLNMKPIPVHE